MSLNSYLCIEGLILKPREHCAVVLDIERIFGDENVGRQIGDHDIIAET